MWRHIRWNSAATHKSINVSFRETELRSGQKREPAKRCGLGLPDVQAFFRHSLTPELWVVSGASERVNGWASGPVFTFGFLVILIHVIALYSTSHRNKSFRLNSHKLWSVDLLVPVRYVLWTLRLCLWLIYCKYRLHCGPKQPRIQFEVLGHSLVRSLAPSSCSLICLLHTTRFARTLHCAHSVTHSWARVTMND